jgi:hypothetical protein
VTDAHLEGCYAFRRGQLDELKKDLIGPSSETETIRDAPLDQYVTGILYPPGDRVDAVEDDGSDAESGGDEAASSDPPVAMTNVRNPSSIGITFAVGPDATQLCVTVNAARYEPSGTQEGRQRRGRIGTGDITWQRRSINADVVKIEVDRDDLGSYCAVKDKDGRDIEGLRLFRRVRPPDDQGRRPVTLALVNTLKHAGATDLRDGYAFLQTSLNINADGKPHFVERPARLATLDEEHKSNALLYRHARTYAVGHGCSAGWTFADDNEDQVTAVWTTFMPEYELLLSDSNNEIEARSLTMQWITTAQRGEVIRDLESFCQRYADWIEEQARKVPQLDPHHRQTAEMHLKRCSDAVRRMREGTKLLQDHDNIWKAFVLTNEAMLEQRARADWLAAERPSTAPEPSAEQRWRPFQLGFILLCLDGVARRESDDRRLTDLLWFPTGGGKTEAYLGLIAFATFLRRLSATSGGSDGGGVTALMRYTLRLLTSQQFQRATLLICACESLRRRDEKLLGHTPISIGLWVGQGATPNRHHGNNEMPGTRESLAELRRGKELTTLNPVQITSCPWCGTALDHNNYWLKQHPQLHLVVQCKADGCAFKDGLPVWVVDEDIYRERPTLLIATLDKFAALPWRTEVGNLFNRNSGDGPPDLIIQDELHLIAGPLGTLAGLYETAVATLATRDGVPPKVVASTATIRRAGRQGIGLFAQETRQFPPPALDSRNSYFAVETPRTRRGSRLYAGVMAAGKSQTTLLIRVYAALLQKGLELPAATDEVRDAYWTLVGYFNSLRVLAGARLAVQDDVGEWVERLAASAQRRPRSIDQRIELTSRESSSKIPKFLKDMTVSFPDPTAIDVILATNMISVGVDINRLGLMVLMGQPQGTSEYIQATSRVGRTSPGLVVTLLNASRSRDRSHYEGFGGYHSSLYRQVESTSVTPFSPRARDRALHAVVIALTRHLVPQMHDNNAAALIHQQESQIRRVVWPVIADRLESIDVAEKEEAKVEFDRVLSDWKTRADEVARGGEQLVYYQFRNRSRSLLWEAGADADGDGALTTEAFPTQRSLRDVDTTSHLDLVQ